MQLTVLPRRAGALAAASGLVMLGLAAAPAVASAATSHAASSRPTATPRFVAAPRTARLASGLAHVCPTPATPGVMECLSIVHRDATGQPANKPPAGALRPGQLQAAYGLAAAAAAANKSTIAVVDAYNDTHANKDLKVYRSRYGLPACIVSSGCLKIVNQNGNVSPKPAKAVSWAEEESLDLDMVSAICPRCKILLVEANNPNITSLAKAVQTAAGKAKYVSNSWGSGAEFTGQTSFDKDFNHAGVVITAAGGDAGYGPQWPATSPHVVSVGGTTLSMSGDTVNSESVWDLSGSGCSALESQLAWRKAVVAPVIPSTDCPASHRTDNDVAANADPATGPAVYDSAPAKGLPAGWQQLGGTSASTPIIAAVFALASPSGAAPATDPYPAQYLYADPTGLRDITDGSNGACGNPLCEAGTGYDGPTGLGVPNGTAAFR